jgi:hypothetical protein
MHVAVHGAKSKNRHSAKLFERDLGMVAHDDDGARDRTSELAKGTS